MHASKVSRARWLDALSERSRSRKAWSIARHVLSAAALGSLVVSGCTAQEVEPSKEVASAELDGQIAAVSLGGVDFRIPAGALRVATPRGFVVEIEVEGPQSSHGSAAAAAKALVQAHLSKPQNVGVSEYLKAVHGSRQPSGGRPRTQEGIVFGLQQFAGPASYDQTKIAPPPPRFDFSDEFVPSKSGQTLESDGFIVCTSESYRASDASLRNAALLCDDSSRYRDFYLELQYSRSLLPDWKRIREHVTALLDAWQQGII